MGWRSATFHEQWNTILEGFGWGKSEFYSVRRGNSETGHDWLGQAFP